MGYKLPLTDAYKFCLENGVGQDAISAIKAIDADDYEDHSSSTVRRGYIIDLMLQRGIFTKFADNYWPYGNTLSGQNKQLFYTNVKKSFDHFLKGIPTPQDSEEIHDNEEDPETDEEDANGDSSQRFVMESHLRDFLAKNLNTIEPGLKLFQKDGQNGIEYAIEKGKIDLLAIDSKNRFVVIELKRNRGRSKTIGQLLYYMGWIDKNLAKTPCRGIILAKEITDDLILATQRIPDVSLYKYNMQVSAERVAVQ